MTSKGKAATLFGVVLGAIGAVVSQPDVQSAVPVKYAPWLQLLGTFIAAAGPSLTRSTTSVTRDTDAS